MSESARPQLTPTQWVVLERVAAGEDNATIAVALGLTPKAVKNHLTRIARQLPRDSALSRRAAFSAWYRREGHVYHEEARRGRDGPDT